MNPIAFLETPNAIRRRKVLMHLLVPIVGNKASLEAIVLWEKNFGSNETLLAFAVEYSKLLASVMDIKMEPVVFAGKVIKALLKPPDNLADIHDPVGLGRIMLGKHNDTDQTNRANNSSVF